MSSGPGRVALVLHTHMPYVEGYGTWPFGEEWLWEAVATSYLPLLDLFDAGAPLTLSLTPVVCDQLEAPDAMERCAAFLREVRSASHALDVEDARASGRADLADELERAAAEYAAALARLEAIGPDLLGRLRPHAAWTSSATHAILPLIATDAGIRLQLQTGIAGHRARFGEDWAGGFWLPECAHAAWLDPLLEEAGVHAACVELTDVLGFGDRRNLTPLRSPAGPMLVPLDRATVDLVWGPAGYPGGGAYRDYHHRTTRDHHPWANDGAVYDDQRASAQAQADAADFAARCAERVREGGLCVLAFDTELFGHWWHEGPRFLAAFVAEAERIGLDLVHLDEALADADSAPLPHHWPHITTWGEPHTLRTWSNPAVAEIAAGQRAMELQVLGAGPAAGERAVRELLAVQASDWAFMVTRDLAGDYPLERFRAHRAALEDALAAGPSADPRVRHLAPYMRIAPLLEP
ncbi:MAG TPA: 1,4-alpha-glucan branching protein domain-containing protein [Solirubrobacteraceae bacterium]